MTLLNTTKSTFSKKERGKRHYLTALLLLSALAVPQAVIAMDAEQEHESKDRLRQEKLNDAKSDLDGLENLLQHKGWEGVDNNGNLEWQQGVGGFDKISRQHAYKTLSGIQQTGAISGALELRQRAGAIAQALGFTNLATAFSRSTDNFFEGMPPEMREKIFKYAAGDDTVPRTPDQLSTLLNLSEVDHQTYDDVSQWRQYEREEREKTEEKTIENIQKNGGPGRNNLALRAQINDRMLQQLMNKRFFSNETFIDLSNTGITDVGLASLEPLQRLIDLDLSGCTGITDEGLASLAQLTKLRTLDLSGCTGITDVGLASLAPLRNLKYLYLRGCTGITDERLASLAPLRNLKYLYLSGCTSITDVELASLAQLTKLRTLDLMGCTGITDEGLESLAPLTNLRFLDLMGCTGITDEGLASLAQLTNLEVLYLSGCTSITDVGLASLAPLKRLRNLHLSGCPGITDEGLESLAPLTNLRFLDLMGCTGITMDALDKLRNTLPSTRIIPSTRILK